MFGKVKKMMCTKTFYCATMYLPVETVLFTDDWKSYQWVKKLETFPSPQRWLISPEIPVTGVENDQLYDNHEDCADHVIFFTF